MTERITPLEQFENALRTQGSRRSERRRGAERRWNCPAHDDRDPSLDVRESDDGSVLLTCRAGCTSEAVVAAVGLKMSDLFPRPSRTLRGLPGGEPSRSLDSHRKPEENGRDADSEGLTVQAYADAKCLDKRLLDSFGLRDVRYSGPIYRGAPAIEIPYYDIDGKEVAIRRRLRLAKGEEGDERFRWRTGDKAVPYGLWRLDRARDAGFLVLVEGESDCHTLWSHEVPSLGVPGAGTWRAEWSEHLDSIPIIYAILEPDVGGERFLEVLSPASFADRLRFVRLKGAKDPSDLHIQTHEAGGFADALDAALEQSLPATDLVSQEREERASKAWEGCRELANRPQILELFVTDLAKLGVVGEQRAAKLVFLSVVSRLLERPISVAVRGPSSAGKSFTITVTLRFFPDSAFYSLSGMSDRFLAYDEEPIAHRMIVVAEAAGLGEHGDFLLRTLLSEGRLVWGTVEKTTSGLQARRIERGGPCGAIITTTSVRLHPENETRVLPIPVDDTRAQTGRVICSLAERAQRGVSGPEVAFGEWHALSDWLEAGERQVVLPYAEALSRATPAVAVRQRRDFGQLLMLVKAHALLHRASRGSDTEGRVIARIEDYEAVRELVADLFGEVAGAEVAPAVRETVDAVTKLVAEKPADTVAVVDIAEELKLDKGAASRRVRAAIQAGYLENLEPRKGRRSRIVLGEPLPERLELLPMPEALRELDVEECGQRGLAEWPDG